MKPNPPRAKESPHAPALVINVNTAARAIQRGKNTAGPTEASGTLLAVLPIRNAILFPGMVVPLTIGRSASRKLIDDLPEKDRRIAVFTQRTDDDEKEPLADDLYPVGVTATVMRIIKQDSETMVAIVSVEDRVVIRSSGKPSPYLKARVEKIASVNPPDSQEWKAETASLRESALRLLEHKSDVPEQVSVVIRNIDDAGRLSDFIAGGIDMPLADRQALLEELSVEKRVRSLQLAVASQIQIAELQDKIQKDVQSQFGEMQRRAWLSEQKKAIEKELGEGNQEATDELGKLRARLDAAQLPAAAREQADRELKRLDHIPQGSPEGSVIFSYLETLAALPWGVTTEDNLDLVHARKVLDDDHFGLEKVKRRLVESLAVRKLKPKGRSPILLLLGPPGVGKTSLGQSVAKALGRHFSRVSLGGVRDEADIRGHRRTYIGAMPGKLIQCLKATGVSNPLVLIDEIDKLGRGGGHGGDPASALLELLDPEQNGTFTDHYLDVPTDLSKVLFVCTANVLDTIPGPLLDRMEVIRLSGYMSAEKVAIARRYLEPGAREASGVGASEAVRLTDGAVSSLVNDYARDAGVRNLQKQLEKVFRKVALAMVRGSAAADGGGGPEGTPAPPSAEHPLVIDAPQLASYLGPPPFPTDKLYADATPVGVVTVLAWTAMGGSTLYVECAVSERAPGKGGLRATGQLGDVMRESSEIAHTYARARTLTSTRASASARACTSARTSTRNN
jgi:ATP-dependent Lon protease